LEGPESGVYYRGKGQIIDDNSITVSLPNYVDKLASDFTVQVAPIYDGKTVNYFNVSEVIDGKFTVYGKNGKFFWTVYGKRFDILVEPSKADSVVKGDGPYKWI
jgi:hypothetical protein